MRTVATTDLIENLNWRYAVKKFDAAKKISPETWSAIEEAMVLAPSSYGLQPWRFVVVNDPAVRAKLKAVAWNQSQVTDASHLVVFCRKISVTPADVDACPMEGFDPGKFDEILGTSKAGYLPVVLGTAGYRASDDWLATLPKVRAKTTDVIKHV